MSRPSGGPAPDTSPGPGAQGTTPGSGKRKNRKKNSPRNKQGGDQLISKDQASSEKTVTPSKLDVLGSGASCQAPSLKVTSSDSKSGQGQSKPNFIAELRAESDQILKEQAVYPPEKTKQNAQSGQPKGQGQSKGAQGQKKTELQGQLAPKGQAKSEGAQKKEVKNQKKETQQGQKKSDQDIKKEGQGNKKGEGQNKPESQGNDKVEGQPGDASQKSKAELKAERRAKQEAQRAAKEKKGPGNSGAPVKKEVPRVPDNMMADVEGKTKKNVKKLERQQLPVRTVVQRKVRLFNHLHQYEREMSLTHSLSFSCGGIHPAIVKLGLQYAEGIISGSNARCIGLLAAFKKVISDYTTPPHKELSRDLDARIKPYISFLTQCRPLAVSMGNAIKYIKWQITSTPADMSDMRAKEIILKSIDDYWEEKIHLAGVAIADTTNEKIADGDVIVVYACSSLIRKVLCEAHTRGKRFRVIVVDGRPRLEGKEMLRRLVKAGIKCSYVLISAASYIMKEATKVLLGAHGLLANGFVMSRVGSSMIALIAKSFNVPVLVCCETYKFCKRVQTDSFVCNELGDPDDLVITGKKDPYLMDWRDYQSLSLLNLVYDVTPPEFISMVITEIGMIPCTSVPVVLRVKHLETNDM